MRILVTGATGFLGTALCSALNEPENEVTRIRSQNCDLRNSDALKDLSGRYDVIFHLAAWTQAGDFCLWHPGEQWLINQQINTTVLRWWAEQQPQAKLVSMGTSCAYDPTMELKEENYLLGTPIDGLYTYAMTKRMLHIGQLALNQQYGLKYLTLVPSTLYGPGYHTDGRQMHFIFDLIRKIVRANMIGGDVVLWGDGLQKREIVYVSDFVEIALQLATSQENQLINIGAGEEYSIRDFAGLICQAVGFDPARIKYDTSRYVGAKSKLLDVTKLNQLRRYSMTSLSKGLQQTIDWFIANSATLLEQSAPR